jgi:LPXTG-motif cell wall-anchored protein
MLRRILITGAVVLAAGSVSLSSAGAQDGGYGGCNATVSDTTPTPGQTVTVTGSGAAGDGAVSATLDGAVVGSGTADAAGEFTFSATVPTTASGDETLSVSCGPNRGVDALVLGVSVSSSDDLPRTGSSSTVPMSQAGAAALVLGAVALGGARVRRQIVQGRSL